MTNENRIASMDAVGELPEIGNLLLRESGYPHLPDPAFVPAPKADAWNDAGTKPDVKKVYQTKVGRDEILAFQYWDGKKFCFACGDKKSADSCKGYPETELSTQQWREVQP